MPIGTFILLTHCKGSNNETCQKENVPHRQTGLDLLYHYHSKKSLFVQLWITRIVFFYFNPPPQIYHIYRIYRIYKNKKGSPFQGTPSVKDWQRPTFPRTCAVSSAMTGLTSLFGMGRGGHRLHSHQNILFGTLAQDIRESYGKSSGY